MKDSKIIRLTTIWTLVEEGEESGQELEKAKWLENNGVGVWSSKEASSSSVTVRVARSKKLKRQNSVINSLKKAKLSKIKKG